MAGPFHHDARSADDTLCNVNKLMGPLAAQQLSTLNLSDQMDQAFNGNGACAVKFTLQRVY